MHTEEQNLQHLSGKITAQLPGRSVQRKGECSRLQDKKQVILQGKTGVAASKPSTRTTLTIPCKSDNLSGGSQTFECYIS